MCDVTFGRVKVVFYGYSGGPQTLDIDTRARGNGEHYIRTRMNILESLKECMARTKS